MTTLSKNNITLQSLPFFSALFFFFKNIGPKFCCGSAVASMRTWVRSLALLIGLDLALLWLWFRLTDVAPIRPLPWELLGCGCGPKKKKKKKRSVSMFTCLPLKCRLPESRIFNSLSFFFFRATPPAYGSSQARS